MADRAFFVLRGSERFGPYSAASLRGLAAEGRIQTDDSILDRQTGKIVMAKNVKGLTIRELPLSQPSKGDAGTRETVDANLDSRRLEEFLASLQRDAQVDDTHLTPLLSGSVRASPQHACQNASDFSSFPLRDVRVYKGVHHTYFYCPKCGTNLSFPSGFLYPVGPTVRCPKCRQSIRLVRRLFVQALGSFFGTWLTIIGFPAAFLFIRQLPRFQQNAFWEDLLGAFLVAALCVALPGVALASIAGYLIALLRRLPSEDVCPKVDNWLR